MSLSIKLGMPEHIENLKKLHINELDVYIAIGLTIPNETIKIEMVSLGNAKKLYLTGIEYFNGMG